MLLSTLARATRLFGCALLAVSFAATAQPASPSSPAMVAAPPAQGRPKIGLVLSGGGARGAAHVGVLKVLEELRVPVDLIVGTSMGSIVGASYASGNSLAEMERDIATITTANLFTDRPPRADLPMRRKADDTEPYIIPELGVTGDGITLPKGIVTGVSVEAQLRKLVKFTTVRRFDQLPIPFRAIATDLGTGEMVELKDGSLITAMRASMSVPGGMAPVRVGERQLVDGGLVRNLPIDVARAMGADIVIAVNLGTPLMRPEQITSVLSVTGQMINILTEQNVRRSLAELKPQDILVLPELGDFSAGDFDNLPKTVPIGEAAARKVADRLRALSLPPEQYAALRGVQGPASTDAMITVVDEIRVEGTTRINAQVVRQSMNTEVGKPIDRETLDLDLRRVYGRGDFENVGYTVEEVDGKRVLTVTVQEKPETHYIRFGLELEADLGQRSYFNVFVSHRAKGLNRFGAEWKNDAVLGRDVLLATEFYQPLSAGQYFFIAPQLRYQNKPLDLYNDDLLVAEYQDQSGVVQFDVGANFLQYGQARLGLALGERRFSQQSGSVTLPASGTTNIRAAVFDLKLDQFTGVNFPTGGWGADARLYSQLDALGGDNPYNKWRAGAGAAFSAGAHTFDVAASAGGEMGSRGIPVYDQFQLGGFLKLSGLAPSQIRTEEYQFARLGYRTKLADIPLFEGIYFGASLEAARARPVIPVWRGKPVDGKVTIPAGSLYVGVDSPLGPLYLGLGYSSRDNSAVYLFLGRP
ncbi:MAG: patatin-like phospholipase family protein [Burkholderiaceae bacterium]